MKEGDSIRPSDLSRRWRSIGRRCRCPTSSIIRSLLISALATAHVNDRLDVYYGQVNGPNRWIDTSYVWNSLVGLKWNSADSRTTILDYFRVGPDQLPYFPRRTQFPVPGFPPPPFMAGKRNVGYTHRPRYFHSFMISHHWTDRLTEAFENDFVIDVDSPGFGVDGTTHTTSIYGFVHWLLYDFNPEVMGFWRTELFADPFGAATGLADTYYEITVGCRYKPKSWLWIRPRGSLRLGADRPPLLRWHSL